MYKVYIAIDPLQELAVEKWQPLVVGPLTVET